MVMMTVMAVALHLSSTYGIEPIVSIKSLRYARAFSL